MKNIIEEDDYYFTKEDFDIFEKSLQTSKDINLNKQRKEVQDKLLHLNPKIISKLNGKKLFNHYNSKNITSLPYCHPRNNFRVNWIGLRYGQDPKVIKDMNAGNLPEDDGYSFLQFACIQVSVVYEGLQIALFHSIPQNSFDRGYLHDHIDDSNFADNLVNIIDDLKGLGLYWDCNGTIYEFDKHDNSYDFIDWYKKEDEYGTYSICAINIPRWDIRLLQENLLDSIMFYIDKLYYLLEVIRWKI